MTIKEIAQKDAIQKAIDYCVDNNILKNFFQERGSEVLEAMLYEMTIDETMKTCHRNGREEGRKKERTYFLELLDRGVSLEEIKQCLADGDKQRVNT